MESIDPQYGLNPLDSQKIQDMFKLNFEMLYKCDFFL